MTSTTTVGAWHRWPPAVPAAMAAALWAGFVVFWASGWPTAAFILGLLLLPLCGFVTISAYAAAVEHDRRTAAIALVVASVLGNPLTVLLLTLVVTGYRF